MLTSPAVCDGVVVYAFASHYPDADDGPDIEFDDAQAYPASTLESFLDSGFPDAWRGKTPMEPSVVLHILEDAVASGMAPVHKRRVSEQLAELRSALRDQS